MMEFPGHSFPNNTISFPPHSDVLKYLQSYADKFDLKKYIQFNHLVIRVHPIENNKWEVIVKNLSNDKYVTQIFDAVFVCNGHFFAKFIPKMDGANQFKGKLLHSHDFRDAEHFKGMDESNLAKLEVIDNFFQYSKRR